MSKDIQKYLIIVFPLVFGLLLLGAFFLGRITVKKSPPIVNVLRASLLNKKQNISKTFSFSVKNDLGIELTQVTYQISDAQLQYDIILNGQHASAVKGKVFLILAVRLTNTYDKNIQINSRDYIRLSMNNKPDLFAPSMHNDPVQLDAISTKDTRLGFTMNESDKNLILHIGEIDGKKTTIPLKLL